MMVVPPTDREQVEFLTKLQRLLAEGGFTASYKFALLLALADIAVEAGDDSGAALHVPLRAIAEKFIRLYWPQAAPHPRGGVLHQNTDQQAAIVNELIEARSKRSSLAAFSRDARAWKSLVTKVTSIIRSMPLFKLQSFGGDKVEFLYPNVEVNGGIELRPGVAFCLRRFHGLIEDLVRGAWIRFVRRLPANSSMIGEAADLSAFMFGTERAALSVLVPILRSQQLDTCFYCSASLQDQNIAVDHFVPWSMYPNDLGHNFVLADARCNTNKRAALGGLRHLERWWRRLDDHGPALAIEFDAAGIVHDEGASKRVALWAYANAEQAAARLWLDGKKFGSLDARWRSMVIG